jgi:uncharacterized protein (DUF2132 family)
MRPYQSKKLPDGVTLEMILNDLVGRLGWDGFAKHIKINCFSNNPSIKSSLKFLRRTPWARNKVEELYILCLNEQDGLEKSNTR